ncbi:MAG: hypothetical protein P1V97_19265 [Planctomycetota bacterium]|nr:hypothetical protein [Planctomycetota bacterium]
MSEGNTNQSHESTEGATGAGQSPVFTTRRDVEQGILYVGIDLGTSQTVISSSNGTRAVVERSLWR